MRIFVTGGTGVLGRGLIPLLRAEGEEVCAPGHAELNLEDASALATAVAGCDAVYHLATRIATGGRAQDPGAWDENNRLRGIVTGLLVDTALAAGVRTFILPSITFLYPGEGSVDESSPFGSDASRLSSMVVAEDEVRRFAGSGGRGVILRLGLLWGPGTGNDRANMRQGASLHIDDAASALKLALQAPSGVYNVVSDGERVANQRFKHTTGWAPSH